MKKLEALYYFLLLIFSHFTGYFLNNMGYIASYDMVRITGIALSVGTLSYMFIFHELKDMNLNRLIIPQLLISIAIFNSNQPTYFLRAIYEEASPIHGSALVVMLVFLILMTHKESTRKQ